MSDPLFDVVFRGDIVPGHHISEVKQRLAHLFKADRHRIDTLFWGGVVPLKRNIDATAAKKYQTILMKAGARVDVVEAGSSSVRAVSGPRSASPPSGGGKTLAERLAQQSREGGEPGWTLAPVGDNLLSDSERAPIAAAIVDTGRLSLRPLQGDLLDENEKRRWVESDLDLSDFELAEPGGDLLREDEKTVSRTVEIDTSGLDLAPVGSDLGETDKPPPPPPPDTGGLALVN